MGNNLKFNSSICTTREQSQRLLELGLKPETADCCLDDVIEGIYSPMAVKKIFKSQIPAWSLNRLIEMCDKTQCGMTISISNDGVAVDGDLFEVLDNTYDNLISVIEWLIERGNFNKEYLNEK